MNASPPRTIRPRPGPPGRLYGPAAVVLSGLVLTAAAATPPVRAAASPVDRASDQATAELVEQVLAARVAAGGALRTIGSLVAATPQAEIALRQALREAMETSPPRRLPDGRFEVDARLAAARLVEALRKVLSEHAADAAPESIALAAGSPATFAVSAVAGPGDASRPRPRGWRHCHDRQIDLAVRAATVDARGRLARQIAALQAGPLLLGSLAADAPQAARTLAGRIDALPADPPVFEPAGVCRTRVRLSGEGLADLLATLAGQAPEPWAGRLRNLRLPEGRSELVAEGFAVAPPGALPGEVAVDEAPDSSAAGREAPEWVGRTLTARAVGRAPPGVDDPAEARELAVRAARIEARRRLWLQVDSLPLDGGRTIGSFLEDHPEAAAALAVLDRRIEPIGDPSRLSDGDWAVALGLRLDEIWKVLEPLLKWENSAGDVKP